MLARNTSLLFLCQIEAESWNVRQWLMLLKPPGARARHAGSKLLTGERWTMPTIRRAKCPVDDGVGDLCDAGVTAADSEKTRAEPRCVRESGPGSFCCRFASRG